RVLITCLPTYRRVFELPTRRARRSPLSNCVPNARILSCTLGASLKSLRRSVLRIASCSCLLRPKISCAIGLTHICTRSQNENDDLSATEKRLGHPVEPGLCVT